MAWTSEQLEAQWTPMVCAARGVLGSGHEAEECAAEAMAQVLERAPHDVGLQVQLPDQPRRARAGRPRGCNGRDALAL
jgi:hypothetical protein